MCERLANATKELLVVHQKLYDTGTGETSFDNPYMYDTNQNHDIKMGYPTTSPIDSRSPSSHSSPNTVAASPTIKRSNRPRVEKSLSTLLGSESNTSVDAPMVPTYTQAQQQQQDSYRTKPDYYMPSTANPQSNATQQPFDPSSALVTNWNRGSEIDFNSLEFLYDTGLFGQVVFDVNTNQSAPINTHPQQQPLYQSMLQSQTTPHQSPQSYLPTIVTSLPSHHPSQETASSPTVSSATPTANTPSSAFQRMIPQQQQQQQQTSDPSTPTIAYHPSKSLWS